MREGSGQYQGLAPLESDYRIKPVLLVKGRRHSLEDQASFAGFRSALVHLFGPPLLIAICLAASVLARPVPSGTGSGQGPIKPRLSSVSKALRLFRNARAHMLHGARGVPGLADLLYPDSMIPGRDFYLSVKDKIPATIRTASDIHSAKYKCVEMCIGRELVDWRNRGPYSEWLFNMFEEWNECVDDPECQKLSGHVQKIPLEDVQAHQEEVEAKRKEQVDVQAHQNEMEEISRKRNELDKSREDEMLRDPQYREWLKEIALTNAEVERAKEEMERRRREGDDGPLKIVRENLDASINALRSGSPLKYFCGFNGQNKFGGGGNPIFKPGRIR